MTYGRNWLGIVGMLRPYGAALRSWGPGYAGETAKREWEAKFRLTHSFSGVRSSNGSVPGDVFLDYFGCPSAAAEDFPRRSWNHGRGLGLRVN